MREATSAKRSVGIRDHDREFLAHKLPREGRNLCDLRRIFVGSLSERSSPSEPSLANSGAIRSDGRKNPSVGFLRPQKS